MKLHYNYPIAPGFSFLMNTVGPMSTKEGFFKKHKVIHWNNIAAKGCVLPFALIAGIVSAPFALVRNIFVFSYELSHQKKQGFFKKWAIRSLIVLPTLGAISWGGVSLYRHGFVPSQVTSLATRILKSLHIIKK